jgi:hypothetical protein
MEQWRWAPIAASTSSSLAPTRAQVESRGMNSRLILLFTRDRSFDHPATTLANAISDLVVSVHQVFAA